MGLLYSSCSGMGQLPLKSWQLWGVGESLINGRLPVAQF